MSQEIIDIIEHMDETANILSNRRMLEKLKEIEQIGGELTQEDKEVFYKEINTAVGRELFGNGTIDGFLNTLPDIDEDKTLIPNSNLTYEGYYIKMDELDTTALLTQLMEHDLQAENFLNDVDSFINLTNIDKELDIEDHTGLNYAYLKTYELDNLTKEDLLGSTKIRFKRTNLSFSGLDFMETMLYNIALYNQSHVKVFNNMVEYRRELIKKTIDLPNKPLSEDFVKRLKGKVKRKDRYEDAKGITQLQASAIRFKKGNTIKNREDHIDRRLDKDMFKHITLLDGKILNDDDVVYLLRQNRVVVVYELNNHDIKIKPVVYGKINDEIYEQLKDVKNVKDLDLNMEYIHNILGTTVGEINKYGNELINLAKSLKNDLPIDKKEKIMYYRYIRYLYDRMKNLFTITRQATLLINKLTKD